MSFLTTGASAAPGLISKWKRLKNSGVTLVALALREEWVVSAPNVLFERRKPEGRVPGLASEVDRTVVGRQNVDRPGRHTVRNDDLAPFPRPRVQQPKLVVVVEQHPVARSQGPAQPLSVIRS